MTTLQRATPADRGAVEACVHAAYEHYIERIGRPPAPMAADYTDLISRGVVYVLRPATGDGLRGLIVMYPARGALFIENVAVDPAHQHHGLGQLLMACAEDHARSIGVAELTLYTNAQMTENIAFYTRLGYAEVDRRSEAGFSRVFMRKRLA